MVEVDIVHTILPAQVVLDGDPKGFDEVDDRLLLDEHAGPTLLRRRRIILGGWHHFCMRGTAAPRRPWIPRSERMQLGRDLDKRTRHMEPDGAGKRAASKDDLRP